MTSDAGRGATEQLLRAWQDGWQALFGGYQRQITALGTGARTTAADQQPVRSAVERIAAGTQALTLAQLDLAAEWLRLPLALTRPGNTSGLTASYSRLIEAYGQLLAAYVSAAAPAGAFALRAGERAGETAGAIAAAQAETARQTASAGERVSRATIEATATVVEQAAAAAEQATERASNGAQAPADRRIKGNINSRGEKIYHLPGQSSYERTQAEEWFASEEAAQAAGYRRAETPGGGAVKGKITREGERIYHLPGQANYDRVEPDMLFETEEQANAAGFRPSQR
ncbi:MAG TPA: hypothetical protein VFD32_15285 [Dehalococcoidia bacterium]|nr:hypothetical protein [Dehalococcoidia bacterium]